MMREPSKRITVGIPRYAYHEQEFLTFELPPVRNFGPDNQASPASQADPASQASPDIPDIPDECARWGPAWWHRMHLAKLKSMMGLTSKLAPVQNDIPESQANPANPTSPDNHDDVRLTKPSAKKRLSKKRRAKLRRNDTTYDAAPDNHATTHGIDTWSIGEKSNLDKRVGVDYRKGKQNWRDDESSCTADKSEDDILRDPNTGEIVRDALYYWRDDRGLLGTMEWHQWSPAEQASQTKPSKPSKPTKLTQQQLWQRQDEKFDKLIRQQDENRRLTEIMDKLDWSKAQERYTHSTKAYTDFATECYFVSK